MEMNKNMFKSKKFIILIVLIIVIIGLFQAQSYIPRDNEFVRTGNLQLPRFNHSAILLNDGRTFIAGGVFFLKGRNFSPKGKPSDGLKTEIYNPKAGRFSIIGKMNRDHGVKPTLTLLNNGKVLILGGVQKDNETNQAELFNPVSNKFEYTGSLITPRSRYFTANSLQDGRVLITGGFSEKEHVLKFQILKEAELYNPKTGKFKSTGNMVTPRWDHVSVLLNNGKVLVVGGENKANRLSSAELYDPKTGKFTPIGSMNYARKAPNVTLLKDGRVLISGGYDNTECVNTVEIYNPIKNSFIKYGSPRITGCTTTATLLKDGKVLFVGGAVRRYIGHKRLGTSNIYDAQTGKFTQGPETKIPHVGHTATLISDSRVLITGGKKEWGAETRAEIYNYNH